MNFDEAVGKIVQQRGSRVIFRLATETIRVNVAHYRSHLLTDSKALFAGPCPYRALAGVALPPPKLVLERDLSAVRIELTTVVVGGRSVPCPSSRRVALWLLPSSERISAAVRA